MDLSKTSDITETFKWLEETFGGLHALINNAAIFLDGNITGEKKIPILKFMRGQSWRRGTVV